MRQPSVVILILMLVVVLLVSACTDDNLELRIDVDKELYGELVIALDAGFSTPEKQPYDPRGRYASFHPIQQKIIEFMDLHPNVEVRVVDRNIVDKGWYSITSIVEDLNDHFAERPDLVEVSSFEALHALSGELRELSFYIENDYIDGARQGWDEQYASLIDKANIGGGQYILPVRSNPMVVYYSAQLFDQLGIEAPADDWTWDDFAHKARYVQDAGYKTGIMKTPSHIEHVITAYGGSYGSRDMSSLDGYLNSEETVEAFEYFYQHLNPHLEYWSSSSAYAHNEGPTLGISRASDMYLFLNAENRDYKLARTPLSSDGERINVTSLTGLGMLESSRNKELAWELMRFIVGDDPMEFVAVNATAGSDSSYQKHIPEKYEDLLAYIKEESAWSQLSSLQYYISGLSPYILESYDPDEGDMMSYLNRIVSAAEDIKREKFAM